MRRRGGVLRGWLVPLLVASTTSSITGCGGGALPTPTAPTAEGQPRPAQPTPDAVWVELNPDAADQHWTLIAPDEKVMCTLPCARWISATDYVSLQYEKPGTLTVFRMGLPPDLGPPGGTAIATARLGSASRRTGTNLMFGGFALALGGFIAFGFVDGRPGNANLVADGLALGAAGLGLMAAGLGLYVRAMSHSPGVVVRAGSASPRASFAFGPGFAEAVTSSSLHVILTPFGATGTF